MKIIQACSLVAFGAGMMIVSLDLAGTLGSALSPETAIQEMAKRDKAERWEELNARVGELYDVGQHAEAIPVAQEAIALAERAFGPEHPDTAISLGWLASLYFGMGEYARAAPLYSR